MCRVLEPQIWWWLFLQYYRVTGDVELIATALAPLLYCRDLHSPHLTAALVQEQQKEIEQRKQELQALLETKQISQETVTVLITQ